MHAAVRYLQPRPACSIAMVQPCWCSGGGGTGSLRSEAALCTGWIRAFTAALPAMASVRSTGVPTCTGLGAWSNG